MIDHKLEAKILEFVQAARLFHYAAGQAKSNPQMVAWLERCHVQLASVDAAEVAVDRIIRDVWTPESGTLGCAAAA